MADATPKIIKSINEARTKYKASDDDILEEIVKQNPKLKQPVEDAKKLNASSTQIIDEIIKQNQPTAAEQFIYSPYNPVSGLVRGALGAILKKTPSFKGAQQSAEQLQKITGSTEGLERLAEIEKPISPTSKEVIGSAIQTGTLLAPSFLPIATGAGIGAVAKRAATAGGIGATTALGQSIAKDDTAPEAIKHIATTGLNSALVSVGIDATVAGLKWLLSKIPAITSYTSGVPQEALERQYERPKEVAQTGLYKMKPAEAEKKVVENTKKAIKDYRNVLTNSYEKGMQEVIDRNKDVRIGLNDYEQRLLNKVQDIKPLQNVPSKVTNMSVKEAIKLNSELNELLGKSSIAGSPQGVAVRELHNILKNKFTKAFEGYSQLQTTYGNKSTVLFAMEELFDAYSQNPKKITATRNNLTKVFNNNTWAYLDTLGDFEKLSGKNILDSVSALVTRPVLPQKGISGIDELFRLALTPLTSPRLAGAYSRTAGTLSQKLQQTPSALSKYIIPQLTSRLSP